MSKTVAVYSINFGSYRSEIKGGIDNKLIKYEKGIDYYFFTDNKNLKSKNWKIIYVNLKPRTSFLNTYRHTAKYYKFVIPEILLNYDYIMFMDSNKVRYFNQINKQYFNNFIKNNCNNKKDLILFNHPWRNTPQQELVETLRLKSRHREEKLVEDEKNGKKFLEHIKNMKFNLRLPDTGVIIHTNPKKSVPVFREIYNGIINFGLRRDQNVINYILKKNNYESNVLMCRWFHPKGDFLKK
tara:strand:+ start:200 stop:919 length:720 start_codon:yes stop_codon:yes gene_type:complete